MTEEEILQKAYFILGLEPGALFDTVKRRYKRLIMVWHPDRFPTDDGKKDAEEELKNINRAFDQLEAHFEKWHKVDGPCPCQPRAAGASQAGKQGTGRTSQSPGPGPSRRGASTDTSSEEAEARRRSEERARRAAEEAAERERQRQAAASAAAAQQSRKSAVDQSAAKEDERLRWSVAAMLGIVWITLSVFGWVGTGINSFCRDFAYRCQQDHQPHSVSTAQTSSRGTETDTTR